MACPTLLVDASSLLYRAYFSTPDSVRSPDGRPVHAAHGFLGMLARLVADHRPARLACAVDADWRPAWRVELLPQYKAARAAADAPQVETDVEVTRQGVVCFDLLVGLGVAVVGWRDAEAEDVIGTLAAREVAAGHVPVAIVSGDRDLFSLVADPYVCVLYPQKGVGQALRVDEAEITARYGIPGRSYADFAVLRGDPSDGLPGVKGIGEKSAAALLATHGDLDGILAAARSEVAATGALSKVAAALDYVERARRVVTIACDLALPEVDLAAPAGEVDPDVAARAAGLALDGALTRLAAALSGASR